MNINLLEDCEVKFEYKKCECSKRFKNGYWVYYERDASLNKIFICNNCSGHKEIDVIDWFIE